MKIVCGQKSWDVHRAIICSRSGFFDGACSNPFRESQTGVIDLSNDDPEAVEHMVNYFYKLDYLATPNIRRRSSTASSAKSPLSPRYRPTTPVVKKNNKLNLAFVEDPLLATAATAPANLHNFAPHNPLTPPADHDPPEFLGKRALRHDSVAEDIAEMTDYFDCAFLAEVGPNTSESQLTVHSKVYTIAEK